jgi:hypothetical protein
MQTPSCGNCTRRQEVCVYLRITSDTEPLCGTVLSEGCNSSGSWRQVACHGDSCNLMRTDNGTAIGMQLNAALVSTNFVVLLKAVLDHSWFTPVERNLWAKVLAARAESNPYLQHCIYSLVSLQARHSDQTGSVVAYEHHLRASELFRNVTPIVTESNWAAVLAFQVFVLMFELTAQTRCSGAEYSIASTIKMFRWNSTIGKEATPYFQQTEMWQHVQRRTARTKGSIDQGLKLGLQVLDSAIAALGTGTGDLTNVDRRRAESCQQAFSELCTWIDTCKGHPRRFDQYYHWPLALDPCFLRALDDDDEFALMLILYWATVLCRSPMPAVSKWAYRTASAVLVRLEHNVMLQALLVWPCCMLATIPPAYDQKRTIIATQLWQQTAQYPWF